MEKYYKESNDLNYANLGKGLVIMIFVTLILGYCYSLLMYFIPFIYANVFITVGLGIVLLFCFDYVAVLTKVRGKRANLILAAGTILFVSYFQWVAFLGTIMFEAFPSLSEYLSSLTLIFRPSDLFPILSEVYTYGTWSLGSAGIPVRGLSLLIIWIIELGILTLPIAKKLWSNPVMPFSDKYNKWYKKYTLDNDYQVMMSKSSIEDKFKNGIVAGIKSLSDGHGYSHCKIHLYFLEGENNQYISVDKIFIEERGKGKTKVTPILENYRIDTSVAKEIQSNFNLTKNGIYDIASLGRALK